MKNKILKNLALVVKTNVVIIGVCLLTWLMTCAFIYFITICIGLNFSFRVSTTIWLCAVLVKLLFKIDEFDIIQYILDILNREDEKDSDV